jgi:hypothetical protein
LPTEQEYDCDKRIHFSLLFACMIQ